MTKVLLSPSFKQMVYIVIVNRYVFLTFFFETPDHKKNWYEIIKKKSTLKLGVQLIGL